jgi:Flp pilus assembly protein TadG
MAVAHHRRARPSSTRSDERGAVLVEMAFIAGLLLLLVAGTFDYGFAWRSGLAATEASRTGARVGSSQSVSPAADFYALNGVRSALNASGKIGSVERVVIYRSQTADGEIPASCKAASPTGACNVLTGAQLNALTAASYNVTIPADPAVAPTGTGCLRSSAALHAGWCPNTRNNIQASGPDYYGVYVKLRYDHQFPFVGSATTVERTSVMRLEPAD